MFGRLALVLLAFSVARIDAQDFGGDFDTSVDSSSYIFNGSNGCALGFCNTGASQVLDTSGLAGVSQNFVAGFSPSQLQSLGSSFSDQMQSIQAAFSQAINQVAGAPANALDSTVGYLQSTAQGVLNDPSGAALKIGGAVVGLGLAAFPPADFVAGGLFGSGLSLSTGIASGSSVYAALGDVAGGLSVDLSAFGSDVGPIIYNSLGVANSFAEIQEGNAPQASTFQAPIIDVSPQGSGIGAYNGLGTNGNYINVSPQNGLGADNSLQSLFLLSQMMSSLGPHTLQQIPLAQNASTSSGICPQGYVPNASAFADMNAGFAPGANEYLCVASSGGQSASSGKSVISSSNVKAPSQGVTTPATSQSAPSTPPKTTATGPQTATSTPPATAPARSQTATSTPSTTTSASSPTATSLPAQSSSGSGLCPNPAANVSNPQGVTPVSGSGLPPGAVTSPNAPGSSYVPILIPCSQVTHTSGAAKAMAVTGGGPAATPVSGSQNRTSPPTTAGAAPASNSTGATRSVAGATIVAQQTTIPSKKPIDAGVAQRTPLQPLASKATSTPASTIASGNATRSASCCSPNKPQPIHPPSSLTSKTAQVPTVNSISAPPVNAYAPPTVYVPPPMPRLQVYAPPPVYVPPPMPRVERLQVYAASPVYVPPPVQRLEQLQVYAALPVYVPQVKTDYVAPVQRIEEPVKAYVPPPTYSAPVYSAPRVYTPPLIHHK